MKKKNTFDPFDDHPERPALSSAGSRDTAFEPCVSVAVTLGATDPGETVVYVTDHVGSVALVRLLWRSGGWRSIRVEPLRDEHGYVHESAF